jgi:hypothetical protein
MPLLTIIFILFAVGAMLSCINIYGKDIIDAKILKIINFVVILAVVLWLLRVFGVMAYLNRIIV